MNIKLIPVGEELAVVFDEAAVDELGLTTETAFDLSGWAGNKKNERTEELRYVRFMGRMSKRP